MGHRNIQFTGHMIDMETDQQGHSLLHPDPCIFYGNVANFPQPNVHSVVPAPGNQCNFNFHPMPDRHDGALFYGMPPYNAVQPQHQAANLDLAVAAPSGHFNPYLAPPSGIRDFPVQVNHGGHDWLSLSTTQAIIGIPTDGVCRNIPYIDGVRGSFKRKNAEGPRSSFQFQNASAGTSSSVGPITARPAELDSTQNAASFLPPEYGQNESAVIVESGSLRSTGMIGSESVLAHNASHLIQGNFVAPPVPLPGNPWLDMHFSANNGDIGTFAWVPAPNLPHVHAGFLHTSIAQGHPGPHHPTPPVQGMRGYNVNYPSELATSSHRIPMIISSNTGIRPFQDVGDAGPTFQAPIPPTNVRLYRPHRREIILNTNARHRNFSHLRILPEDEVAILEIPRYHEAGDSIDQHRDMRLDIDHMSYEELLALEEQIGSVGTGLSEEFIQNNLKTRTFTSSPASVNLEDPTCHDQQKINFCVVCQTDYKCEENIGTLDCGHEYHRECIKKWLLVKNTCPVCKSTALSSKGKDLLVLLWMNAVTGFSGLMCSVVALAVTAHL
ncbi:putative E3 ubiquitin-protein ligase ZFP1 [Sesamum angolense]|uniref:RING-type E3 ubiquitin transferase n=1 Tax=Sesamum angolense TaxID=2727404 RepID=A0AAE2BUK0_9LAMI|nr:putative E3 ubiquitin-protein ligase ZFP1 [Sesamum angolense]